MNNNGSWQPSNFILKVGLKTTCIV